MKAKCTILLAVSTAVLTSVPITLFHKPVGKIKEVDLHYLVVAPLLAVIKL